MNSSTLKSILLIPTNLAIPVYVAPEEIEVGRTLFHNFVHDELEHEGLSDDMLLEEVAEGGDQNGIIDENFAFAHNQVFQGRLASTPDGYKSIAISQVGASIRELANEFAQSRQRESIRREADEVDLGALNYNEFWSLLEEVFKDGITSHNLIALFFFCSDVLIRCVRLKLRDIGMNLFRWSLKYIVERVCRWVHKNGGWVTQYVGSVNFGSSSGALHRQTQEKAIRKAVISPKYIVAAAIVVLATVGWFSFKGIKK